MMRLPWLEGIQKQLATTWRTRPPARQPLQKVSLCTWLTPFGDPVELVDATGTAVVDVSAALAQLWWDRRQTSRSVRRTWLDALYPAGMEIMWPVSTGTFRRPLVAGRQFVHPTQAPVVKWLARVRAGCLASRLRLFSHRMEASPACVCCGASEEDEAHVVSGCPATGTVD